MAIPKHVMEHPDYYELSGSAVKLLNEVAKQYTTYNNGKLCIVWSQLKERGFKSQTTLNRAKNELIDRNLIKLTKHGYFSQGARFPNFYALTWANIDEVPGFDMDVSPSNKALRHFRKDVPP